MIRTSKSLWSLRKNESMLISMRILSVQGKSLYIESEADSREQIRFPVR